MTHLPPAGRQRARADGLPINTQATAPPAPDIHNRKRSSTENSGQYCCVSFVNRILQAYQRTGVSGILASSIVRDFCEMSSTLRSNCPILITPSSRKVSMTSKDHLSPTRPNTLRTGHPLIVIFVLYLFIYTRARLCGLHHRKGSKPKANLQEKRPFIVQKEQRRWTRHEEFSYLCTTKQKIITENRKWTTITRRT